MRHVTFYHAGTGILNGVSVLVSDDKAVELNEKLYPGHKAIDHPVDGRLDHLRQRVDVSAPPDGDGALTVIAWDAPAVSALEAPSACPCPKHKS